MRKVPYTTIEDLIYWDKNTYWKTHVRKLTLKDMGNIMYMHRH